MKSYEIIYIYLIQKEFLGADVSSMELASGLDVINSILVSIEQKANSTSFCLRITAENRPAQRDIYESAAIHLVRGKD